MSRGALYPPPRTVLTCVWPVTALMLPAPTSATYSWSVLSRYELPDRSAKPVAIVVGTGSGTRDSFAYGRLNNSAHARDERASLEEVRTETKLTKRPTAISDRSKVSMVFSN